MKKKLQVALTEETWTIVSALMKEANDGFKNGSITFSDIINEMLSVAKIDIRLLQAKHTNIRKSLRLMAAQPEIDIDSAIRALMDLKAKGSKRLGKSVAQGEGADS